MTSKNKNTTLKIKLLNMANLLKNETADSNKFIKTLNIRFDAKIWWRCWFWAKQARHLISNQRAFENDQRLTESWSIHSSCANGNRNLNDNILVYIRPFHFIEVKIAETRSSWLNCALPSKKVGYWVSKGQEWLVLGGTESLWGDYWCHWVTRGH